MVRTPRTPLICWLSWCLYEPAVVGCFGQDFVEACGEPVLVLEGEAQIVGRAVCGEVLSPVGAAEEGDVPLQRGDASREP
ncbi:hypothetical protein [Streptomyces chartreusis]